jgi:hypothetical protein
MASPSLIAEHLCTQQREGGASGKDKVPQHVPQRVAAALCDKYVALPQKSKINLILSTATRTLRLANLDDNFHYLRLYTFPMVLRTVMP